MARSRLHRRYGRRKKSGGGEPRYKNNPPLFTELAEYIVPGFAGFAGARFLTRVVSVVLAKRFPRLAKHAGVLSSVSAFLAIWLLAHRVKFLAKYQSPLAVGTGLATLQTIIQTYIPKVGWIVSDATPQVGAAAPNILDRGDVELTDDDPNYYTYDDKYDSGRMGRAQHRADARAAGQPTSAPEAEPQMDDEIDIDVEEATGAASMGIFSN